MKFPRIYKYPMDDEFAAIILSDYKCPYTKRHLYILGHVELNNLNIHEARNQPAEENWDDYDDFEVVDRYWFNGNPAKYDKDLTDRFITKHKFNNNLKDILK